MIIIIVVCVCVCVWCMDYGCEWFQLQKQIWLAVLENGVFSVWTSRWSFDHVLLPALNSFVFFDLRRFHFQTQCFVIQNDDGDGDGDGDQNNNNDDDEAFLPVANVVPTVNRG